MERIESVEKIIAENLTKKGISKFMSNINLPFISNIEFMNEKEMVSKTIDCLARRFQKMLSACKTYEQIQDVIDCIPNNKGIIQIEMQPIHTLSEHDTEYITHLTYEVLKRKNKMEQLKKPYLNSTQQYLPIYVSVYNKSKRDTPYCFVLFGNMNVPKSVDKYRGFRLRGKKEYAVKSFAKVLAIHFLNQAIIEFVLKNPETYEYVALDRYLKEFYRENQEKLYIPDNELEASIVLEQLNKYQTELPVKKIIKSNPRWNQKLEAKKLKLVTDEGKISNITHEELLGIMIREFIMESDYIKRKSKRIHDNLTEYAKAYQTKKQISEQHKIAMKENKFLLRFKEVELDNIVDLEKFKKIENEFIKLSSEIYIPTSTDVSFRIKRLGKHRASGLYYPNPIGCLIIDRNGVSSFVHEIAHMFDFDFKGYQLSEQLNFRGIYELYRQEIISLAQVNNNVIGQRKLDYYLEKAEVFARSFELYVCFFKGVRNSLLKTPEDYEDGLPYPIHNKEYMRRVKIYFDKLFDSYSIEPITTRKNTKNTATKLLPASEIYFHKEEKEGVVEQLCLF